VKENDVTILCRLHEDKESGLDRNPWNSEHCFRRLSVEYIGISETSNEDLGELHYRVYVQPNRPDNIEVEPEDEADRSPTILQNEVEKSMKQMRENNAAVGGDTPGDVLGLLGENGLRIMTEVIDNNRRVEKGFL